MEKRWFKFLDKVAIKHYRRLTSKELHEQYVELQTFLSNNNPSVKKMSQEEFFNYTQTYIATKRLERRKKMAKHLEFFNDGVTAIIITIMVLEIPIPNSLNSVPNFLNSIIVFFISFIIIANFWMMHHDVFSRAQKGISRKIVVADFLFMFEISLIPILTKWMIQNHYSNIPVILYGVIYMLSLFTLTFISMYLNKIYFHGYPIAERQQCKISKLRLMIMLPINIAYIILAIWFPKIIFLLYISLPLVALVYRVFTEDDIYWIDKQLNC